MASDLDKDFPDLHSDYNGFAKTYREVLRLEGVLFANDMVFLEDDMQNHDTTMLYFTHVVRNEVIGKKKVPCGTRFVMDCCTMYSFQLLFSHLHFTAIHFKTLVPAFKTPAGVYLETYNTVLSIHRRFLRDHWSSMGHFTIPEMKRSGSLASPTNNWGMFLFTKRLEPHMRLPGGYI